jgi:hypothetical protein
MTLKNAVTHVIFDADDRWVCRWRSVARAISDLPKGEDEEFLGSLAARLEGRFGFLGVGGFLQ